MVKAANLVLDFDVVHFFLHVTAPIGPQPEFKEQYCSQTEAKKCTLH